MSSSEPRFTTGLPELDGVLKGILPGDNVVWQVERIEDYRELVDPCCAAARESGRRLVYFRFASHRPLVLPGAGAEIHELRPDQGFEGFIARIHAVIEQAGRGAVYVFDGLSELAADWYSDQMLGNFFMLTCPYLYDMETLAYFALLRDYHSSDAIGPISQTTQLFIDVYRHAGRLYVRPLKVQHRHSPTMNLLHVREGDGFRPVTSSVVIAEVLTSFRWSTARGENPDSWERAFARAQDLVDAGEATPLHPEERQALYRQVARMILSRDEAMLRLAERYLGLDEIVRIRRRMIGTGLIGGKTVGMLLARAILKRSDARFERLLEEHDSFYIGSDVFYTFLVRNGVWWVRQRQRDPASFLDGAEQARRRILTGNFPDTVVRQFEEMLDYFGQSPIIVRSSSLLEDNFGNSFAGKYDSVFCANQGPRERRLEDFLAAVRTIYASTMSERALSYRARRGMLDQDEQMALLVMRVSGAMVGRDFYPQMAGVGFSFNPYAWNENIDPRAGVIRLVFGLGTRAVNRTDDDYTRLIALNAPERRPESNFDEVRQYSQRRVDYLDLEANQLVSGEFETLAGRAADSLPLALLADRDPAAPAGRAAWILTFNGLLGETPFVADLRELLRLLQEAYRYPVDIEFTANFVEASRYRINLVQCRPLQVHGGAGGALPRVEVRPADRLIEARGAVIGHSRLTGIDRFVYVVPARYGALPDRDRYAVARLIGKINHAPGDPGVCMLLGPGRWGTTTPSLGIPVSFSDINRVAVLCEIVAMREDLVPDVSLGTHFLNELVEMDMLYLALFPGQGDNYLARAFFEESPNRLADLVPDAAARWGEVVRVIDMARLPAPAPRARLAANPLEQRVSCYLER